MKTFKRFAFSSVAAALLFVAVPSPARAQVNINVQIGPQPVCPYGYFDYTPYRCAPFGYYGPQWFQGGLFIGAGPWFHGPEGFRGDIDRHFDPRFGYHGYLPRRDERADWNRHRGWEQHWHGSEQRQEYRHDNGNHNGQYNGHGNPHDNGNGRGHDNGHGNRQDKGHDHGDH